MFPEVIDIGKNGILNNLKDFLEKRECICVVGLGYVGLPLAVLFSSKYDVIGFDINTKRIEELKKGHDSTLELEDEVLQGVLVENLKTLRAVKEEILEYSNGTQSEVDQIENVTPSEVEGSGLYVTRDLGDIIDCNHYIIIIPTPIDKNNRPDLTPLYKSSESVGKMLK
ncbi:hypothetical protein LCGC14_2752980, partial [marine sediment metagenome]